MKERPKPRKGKGEGTNRRHKRVEGRPASTRDKKKGKIQAFKKELPA